MDAVDLGVCVHCAGFWFGRAELPKIALAQTVQAILSAAHGKPGRCKSCNQVLASDGPCPRCEQRAPACPDCGRAPLALGNVHGVNLDVCLSCAGVWFDAGELQLVVGRSTTVLKIQSEAFKEASATEAGAGTEDPNERVHCGACEKVMTLHDAFIKDDLLYCGSCCPVGAAPVVPEFTPRESTVVQYPEHIRHPL